MIKSDDRLTLRKQFSIFSNIILYLSKIKIIMKIKYYINLYRKIC